MKTILKRMKIAWRNWWSPQNDEDNYDIEYQEERQDVIINGDKVVERTRKPILEGLKRM